MIRRLVLVVCLVLTVPAMARAQLGTPFVAANVQTVMPCVVGNLAYQTTTPAGLFVCTAPNTWTPSPAVVVNNGPALPTSCIVGTVFTVTPGGALFSCPIANTFIPVAATVITKTILGLVNNVFADVLTITVPNAAVGAVIEITLTGSLGAGGSVGPFEATTGRVMLVTITRTPGVATDAQLVVAQNAGDARVVGATTIAQMTQLSAISGAPTGAQTLTVQYRITRGAGASTNHVAAAVSRIISPSPTAITIQ